MQETRPARALERVLDPKLRYTVADAAAKSGLSLADADRGLHELVKEYRGHLRVTEEGELVFLFPTGFSKPWETTDAIERFGKTIARGAEGAARFVVRAWVAIVLVGYVAIFLAIAIAFMFARSGSSSDSRSSSRSGAGVFGLVIRMLADALFWTFHPFSPISMTSGYGYGQGYGYGRAYDDGYGRGFASGQGRSRANEPRDTTPFYEKVDRFFFGPKEQPVDPAAEKRAVLLEIRASKGRIGLADVMRVTGKSRDVIDPLMSELLLDYEGSVDVSEDGGIVYSFPKLRKTAEAEVDQRRPAIWETKVTTPPVTGNSINADLLIGGLNAFNLFGSIWAIANSMTIERLIATLKHVLPNAMPAPSAPLVLGWIPFVFSVLLFVLPVGRLLLRSRKARKTREENGRRAVLKAIVENAPSGGVTDAELKKRYRVATDGLELDDKALTKQVVALGGDVDLAAAERGVTSPKYRFMDIELAERAAIAEREAADEEEVKLGKVVFSSEN